MGRLTKITVTVLLVIIGLCHTSKPAKADLFGVADTALLAQQIAQFCQDWGISGIADLNFSELISDIDSKVRDFQKIVNIFENGQRGYAVFNSAIEVTRKLTRMTRYISNYVKYIGTIGDDVQLTNCYYAYRKFNNKTRVILNSMESTLRTMQKMDSEEGSNILRTIDSVIQSASSALDTVSNECLSDLADVIHENKMEKQAKSSTEMINLVIG